MLLPIRYDSIDRLDLHLFDNYQWVPIISSPPGYKLNFNLLNHLLDSRFIFLYKPIVYRSAHVVWLCIDSRVSNDTLLNLDRNLRNQKHFSFFDLHSDQVSFFEFQLQDVFGYVDWHVQTVSNDLIRFLGSYNSHAVVFDFNIHIGSFSGPCLNKVELLFFVNQISEHFFD